MSALTQHELQQFALEFREGLIGTQPNASRSMCVLVSMPLRAALQVLLGVETNLVTEAGHTYLVTADGQCRIDPTIDQFHQGQGEKVLIAAHTGPAEPDARLTALPFPAVMEEFKRLCSNDGRQPCAREAGVFVATFIYYPLAQQGFFDERMR